MQRAGSDKHIGSGHRADSAPSETVCVITTASMDRWLDTVRQLCSQNECLCVCLCVCVCVCVSVTWRISYAGVTKARMYVLSSRWCKEFFCFNYDEYSFLLLLILIIVGHLCPPTARFRVCAYSCRRLCIFRCSASACASPLECTTTYKKPSREWTGQFKCMCH